MSYKSIPLDKLLVNRENDRHGELENETTAIAWLFSNHLSQMKKLARDVVQAGGLYEPPLVYPDSSNFIVYDGNRRTTCLKLLANPKRAPDSDLQKFFADLRGHWRGNFPTTITCRVESDRDEIDEILFRRHTGSQGGVGQSNWNDRMKTTFVNRTGKGGKLNVADEIEERLTAANLLPKGKRIPRSNLNRLLSAEAFRSRVGISTAKGRFQFIRKEDVSLKALARIADDLAHRRITLDDVWDVDRKSEYPRTECQFQSQKNFVTHLSFLKFFSSPRGRISYGCDVLDFYPPPPPLRGLAFRFSPAKNRAALQGENSYGNAGFSKLNCGDAVGRYAVQR